MEDFNKTLRIGTIETHGGSHVSIFCSVEFVAGRLSISGVIGPRSSGNCYGGCGQIDMEFAHRNSADDDSRYSKPIQPQAIKFAAGWNREKWLTFLDYWKDWHLNDMQAGCEHQRKAGQSAIGEICEECGYSYGSKWLTAEIPADVLEFLASLPDADRQPAWV